MRIENKKVQKEYVSPSIEMIATILDSNIMLPASMESQLHEFEDGGEEDEDDGDL